MEKKFSALSTWLIGFGAAIGGFFSPNVASWINELLSRVLSVPA